MEKRLVARRVTEIIGIMIINRIDRLCVNIFYIAKYQHV